MPPLRTSAVGLVLCGMTVACSGGTASRPAGHIVGVVRVFGGPFISSGQGRARTASPAANARPESNIQVTLIGAGGRRSNQRTGNSGHFAFETPPGRYTLRAACSAPPIDVVVHPRSTTHVSVRCVID